MIPLETEKLIALWKSNKTFDELAKDLGVDRRLVMNAFRRLKDQGHISGDRPRSRMSYARGDDGRPYGLRDDGTMLERLRAVHKERDPHKHD